VRKWLFALLMSCLSKKLTRLSAVAAHLHSAKGEKKSRHPADNNLYLKVKDVSHFGVEKRRVFDNWQA
jgi:hypothetical protein